MERSFQLTTIIEVNIKKNHKYQVLEEYDVNEPYGGDTSLQQIFDSGLGQQIGLFIRGLNINIFAYGSSGAGKSVTIEGNKKEHGLVMLYMSSLFSLLESKRLHSNSESSSLITNYTYQVHLKFIEIIKEEITDLLQTQKKINDGITVLEEPWTGPTLSKVEWTPILNEQQFADLLQRGLKNKNNTSNEMGKLSSKSTGIIQIRLIQTSQLRDTNEPLLVQSVMSFYDLPGSEILVDDPETLRIKQGQINKVIISITQLFKDLANKDSDYILYDTTTVIKLNKETLGANAVNIGIFCLQHGDHKGSSLTLQAYTDCTKIQSYPIINDGKTLAILKKFRLETQSQRSGKMTNNDNSQSQNDNGGLQKVLELERMQNENQQQIMELNEERQRLASKLTDLRNKYTELVKQKTDLQSELIKSEEDKLEVSKALIELEMENSRLMDIIQNEKYNQNNKLLGEDADLLAANVREEKALNTIRELQDRLKEVLEDKRELEIEFMVLKKNYMNINVEVESERLKQEGFGLQLINLANENKTLQQELSDFYKKTGNQTEEGKKLVERIDQLERIIQEKDEKMIYTNADNERLKIELIRNDVKGQQSRINSDQKGLDLAKSLFSQKQSEQTEENMQNKENQEQVHRIRDDKMQWESQKMELTHKVKSLQRKVNDYEERFKEQDKMHKDLLQENKQIQISMDEMRAVYRNKLIQFTTESVKGKTPDVQAREEIVRDFSAKEQQLVEEREKNKVLMNQQKIEIKALRSYSRNLKYLAEDWAPVGSQLPDVLAKEPPFMVLDETQINSYNVDQQNEIIRVKNKNKRLEDEITALQSKLQELLGPRPKDINSRIMDEIELLKGDTKRPPSSSKEIDTMRKERNDLQEENRKLVTFLKDNKKWDILLLQRENDRLMRMVRDNELTNVGPISGENKGLVQKLQYYEKALKSQEREKTELMIRSTMAEEQLATLQTNITRITSDYQKKIQELKKQLHQFQQKF